MADNAIQFVRDQAALLRGWRDYSLRRVAPTVGFGDPVLLGSRPSRFLGRIYAAATSLNHP